MEDRARLVVYCGWRRYTANERCTAGRTGIYNGPAGKPQSRQQYLHLHLHNKANKCCRLLLDMPPVVAVCDAGKSPRRKVQKQSNRATSSTRQHKATTRNYLMQYTNSCCCCLSLAESCASRHVNRYVAAKILHNCHDNRVQVQAPKKAKKLNPVRQRQTL